MKIKTAFVIGLFVMQGTAYAVMVNGLPISFPGSIPKIANGLNIQPKIISKECSHPVRPESKSHSKIEDLILTNYRIERALCTSS